MRKLICPNLNMNQIYYIFKNYVTDDIEYNKNSSNFLQAIQSEINTKKLQILNEIPINYFIKNEKYCIFLLPTFDNFNINLSDIKLPKRFTERKEFDFLSSS
jgi:hypothetical protein